MAIIDTQPPIIVLKFGSSVLRSAGDLPAAVQCIYRYARTGRRVVAVVSAFAGETDRLFAEAQALGLDRDATAVHVANGERAAAGALEAELERCGVPAQLCDPANVGLQAVGPVLDSMLDTVDIAALGAAIERSTVTVLPGFFAADARGRTVLLGRGGSDLTAIWIADRLGAACTLVKDVDGLYQRDPALPGPPPARLEHASWSTAVAVGGRLLQKKAVEYAHIRHLAFSVTSPWSDSATLVGPGPDQIASPAEPLDRRLRVALLGCGTVGGGVLERLRSLESRFEVTGVLVRDIAKHGHRLRPGSVFTTDGEALLAAQPDIVIELLGGSEPAATLIDRALAQGGHVISANKALIAAAWTRYETHLTGSEPRLRCSAAVGGALPMLECLATIAASRRVTRLRAVINGTTNFILDGLARGETLAASIREAQARGYAEADPTADIDGLDAASKLSLLARIALRRELEPEAVATCGIRSLDVDWVAREHRNGRAVRLVAEFSVTSGAIKACVEPVSLDPHDYLAGACGAANRLEIHCADGSIHRHAGQGAGRWPTTTAVIADLEDVETSLRRRIGIEGRAARARRA